MSADLLGLFEAHELKPKKKTGKEWGAACPACGGTDRCMVRPYDHDGRGGYHCRQCGAYGDNIQFLRDYEGLSYEAACARAGVKANSYASLPKPPRKAPGQEPFEAASSVPPAELWLKRAAAFAAWAHEHLLNAPDQLAWLAARGLPLEAVQAYRLGWNPGERGKSCLIRPRKNWGLPVLEPKEGADGKPGKAKTTFWIPRGIVIPMLGPDGDVRRLRIRRPDSDRQEFREETKYYVVPGSGMDALVLGRESQAFVVVESELDALMLHHQAGDLAGAVSIMTASVRKIEASALDALSGALCVLVALDFDEAGGKGWARWSASLPRAKRWPCPVGKDPGEAFEQGANLRAWVLAGLPPALQPGLLPAGQPDGRGEGEEKAGAAAAEGAGAPAEPAQGVRETPAAPVETPSAAPLPAWAHPLEAADLAVFTGGGTPLVDLCAGLQAAGLIPAVYVSAEGERGLVLRRTGPLVCDPVESARLARLFFDTLLADVLAVINPKAMRRARNLGQCVGIDFGPGWGVCAPLVALDPDGPGLAWQGWQRLEGWK